MKLLLLRHATTPWNEARRLQGRSDIGLSAKGRAEAAAWHLPHWARGWPVLTSPLKRAQETALLMGCRATTVPWLVEMDWGRWEGWRLGDLRKALGPKMAMMEARGLDLHPPGGESPRAVGQRLLPFLQRLPKAEGYVLVAHKGVIRALLASATGWDMRRDWPESLRPAKAHLFLLNSQGRLQLGRLNLELCR